MAEHDVVCPLCKGEGWIRPKKHLATRFKITEAKKLKSMGLTIREIADAMGYKSHRSVQVLLDKP